MHVYRVPVNVWVHAESEEAAVARAMSLLTPVFGDDVVIDESPVIEED